MNQEGEIIENRLLGWGFGGWNCIGRAVLFGEGGMVACVLNREGGTVLGGCCCRAFFQVVSVCLTLSPSRVHYRFPSLSKSTLPQQNYLPGIESPSSNRITLRIDRESLFFIGFARIGRVVLNQAGGTVGNGWLGWGFGGRNCSGRVLLYGEGGVGARFCWLCLSG